MSGSLYVRTDREEKIIYFRPKGKSNHISTGFPYNKNSIEFVAQMIDKNHKEDLEVEHLGKKKSVKFGELLNQFFTHKEKIEKRKQSTIDGYNQFAKQFFDTKIEISNDKDLENYIDSIAEEILTLESVSNNTINTYMRNLRVFVKYFENELDYEIKFKKIKYAPKRTAREPDNFSPEELESILQYFYEKDYEIYLLILLTLHTAMRISETLSLYFKDIDYKNKIIKLSNTKSKDNEVVLTDNAIEVLQALQELDKKHKKDGVIKDEGKVFRWKYISRSFLNNQMRKCLKELEIHQKFRNFHTLRKTYSQILFDNNANEQTIKGGMRHTKIEITNKHYYKKNNDKILNELNKVESLNVFKLDKNKNPKFITKS